MTRAMIAVGLSRTASCIAASSPDCVGAVASMIFTFQPIFSPTALMRSAEYGVRPDGIP